MVRRLRTKLSRALRSASISFSATLVLHSWSGFLICREAYPASALRAGTLAGRQSGSPWAAAEAGLGLRGRDQPFFDGGLAGLLADPPDGFTLLAGFALGGLLV